MKEHIENRKKKGRKDSGDILVAVMVFAAIALTVTIGLANWGAAMLKDIRTTAAREQAFQVAEAGIDYYRWHLAQYPTDYEDGTNQPGPYYHQFYDKDGDLIGSFKLIITPPLVGSTKVTINSTGTTTSNPTLARIIQAVLAQPSLAQYSVIANDYLRFGAGTQVYGPVNSNYGIRFDGTAYNVISSAVATYTDPDQTNSDGSHNCSPFPACALEWGVWTSVAPADPQPPTPIVNNPAVFTAGRQFPVPAFPFSSLTVSLSNLQSGAGKEWTASGAQGYYMHVNNNNTYDMYKVTALQSAPNNCINDLNQTQWGTWSIKTVTQVNGPNADHSWTIPANGVIFVDDNLWIDGQIDNSRFTIAAGLVGDTNPATYPNITLGSSNSITGSNNNLLYTNLNGDDVIGLVAQGNINVPLYSPNNLTVDAALVSENGRIGRFYYDSYCQSGGTDYHIRTSITLNGMIATAVRYGFAYTDNTGYLTRNINYDANLLYAAPPSFPLASTQYQTISWQQIQ